MDNTLANRDVSSEQLTLYDLKVNIDDRRLKLCNGITQIIFLFKMIVLLLL